MPGNRPSHNRSSSYSGDYRPAQPSNLRQSHRVPSISAHHSDPHGSSTILPSEATSSAEATESTPLIQGQIIEPRGRRPSIHPAHDGLCTHGTFSPRASSPTEPFFNQNWDDESTSAAGSSHKHSDSDSAVPGNEDWQRWLKRRIKTRRMGQSRELAEQAGIRDTPMMFVLSKSLEKIQ